jgi:hypothetical protein
VTVRLSGYAESFLSVRKFLGCFVRVGITRQPHTLGDKHATIGMVEHLHVIFVEITGLETDCEGRLGREYWRRCRPGYRLGAAGTGPDDVVQVTETAIKVLQGRAPNSAPAVLNHRSALWLLAHLVGDIHQPLHVGAVYFDSSCEQIVDPNVAGAGQPNFGIGTMIAATRGGNDLKIGSTGSRRNLHGYWDNGTVTGAIRLVNIRDKFIEDFAQEIVEKTPPGWQTAGDPETWPTQWATEILPTANDALTRVQIGAERIGSNCTWGITLSRGYTRWANQQALTQLGKAGFRLAAVLRAIFEGH